MQKRIALALVAASSLSASACATIGLGGVETAAANAMVSDDQESQLGLQVKSDLETKEGIKYVADAQVAEYVRGVANKILVHAQKDRETVKWTVNVIDDPKTVNAFATPGGYLYVYTGLLLLADNEAQLAGVMGHEAGHVVARHSARQMVNQFGLQAVASLALGQNPGLLSQLGAAVVAKGTMLAHSRSHEDEADEYGARYASLAGYDPRALSTFFDKLRQKMGDTSGISTWLSDHPSSADRIAHIEAYSKQNGLNGKDIGADRFAAIKAKVAALPAQPAQPAKGNPPPSGPSNAPPR